MGSGGSVGSVGSVGGEIIVGDFQERPYPLKELKKNKKLLQKLAFYSMIKVRG